MTTPAEDDDAGWVTPVRGKWKAPKPTPTSNHKSDSKVAVAESKLPASSPLKRASTQPISGYARAVAKSPSAAPKAASPLQISSPASASSSPYAYRPHEQSALNNLIQMFPHVDAAVVKSIWTDCNHNSERAAEYLLQHAKAVPVWESVDSKGRPLKDSFSSMPMDAFLLVCSCVDMFDLGRLSRVNKECSTQVRAILSRRESLSMTRYKAWPDRRIISMIRRFPRLSSLSLAKCKNFRSFEQLASSCDGSHITSLDLSSCGEMEDYHAALVMTWMPRLESIDLSGSNVTDEGLDAIASHQRLQRLVLNSCGALSGKGVANLVQRLRGLRSLHLAGTNTTADAIVFGQKVTLQELNLAKCTRIANFAITSRFCVLRSLSLSSNSQLRSVNLDVASLTELNLSTCVHLTAVRLVTSALRSLNLSGCVALAELKTETGTRLQEANLFSCRALSGASFQGLVRSCLSTIERLDCSGMTGLRSEALVALLDEKTSQLQSLKLAGCHMLTDDSLQAAQRFVAARSESREQAERASAEEKAAAAKRALPDTAHIPVGSKSGLRMDALPVIHSLTLGPRASSAPPAYGYSLSAAASAAASPSATAGSSAAASSPAAAASPASAGVGAGSNAGAGSRSASPASGPLSASAARVSAQIAAAAADSAVLDLES